VSEAPPNLQARATGLTHGRELSDPHAFLHRRVRLYARILAAFFSAFAVIGAIKVLTFPFGLTGWLGVVAQGVFVAVAAAMVAAWLSLRRSRPSMAALQRFESAGTVLAGVALAAAMHVLPGGILQLGIFLSVALMLIVRAAVVPSTVRRTVAVGLLCSVAMALIGYQRSLTLGVDAPAFPTRPDPDLINRWATHYMWTILGSWGVIFTLATGVVSQVIYRLTDTARSAMRLGNYTLERKLGEGGMGVVYLARHALMARPAALKLLRSDRVTDQALRRFEREVRQTSELAHPNTIRVFDFGRTPDGRFYYVMEFLDGLDLAQLVERFGPQPASRVIYVLAQVAHALDEAHRHGLVHRDVKPGNVVLCDLGGAADTAKLLDFGLAKEVDAPPDLRVSVAGKITGTPMYMAPESIVAPEEVDGRTDLYALGAVAYFMVTGHHVFEARTVVEACGHHLHSVPVRPSERLGAPVSEDLEAVLLRCLAKRPEDRFPDTLALRDALLACRDAEAWGLAEARAWWDRHQGQVDARAAEGRGSVTSASADTVAVGLR
jgi:tRNA A-37 threonylcarbamoyl transferase component Bud32